MENHAGFAKPQNQKGLSGLSVALRNVTKRYGQLTVVDSLDVDIASGEFFSLLGPSGSGKSTTLMMVAGFVSVDEGDIVVGGRDISDDAPQQRGFGMVFQNYAIFPHLNVWENVAFPLRVRKFSSAEIKARVQWALDLVRLGTLQARHAKQLSGGQQQRVALARAIVFHPKVVLMDEPMGALDKNLRYEMQAEIKDIQQRLGMTVVYVTHDQEEAMNMSDRIAIMNNGRIEQVSTPKDIYERPDNSFVAKFLGQANLIPGSLADVASDLAEFKFHSGEIVRVQSRSNYQRGLSGLLFVRPEKVSIGKVLSAAPGAVNRIKARVRRVSFLGNMFRYTAVIAGDLPITVDVKNVGDSQDIDVDQEVEVSWRHRDGIILDAGQ